MSAAHAKLSPSSSHRWLNCPGSIPLIEKVPPSLDTDYSIEGSVAHRLAELCLTEKKKAADFLGQKVEAHGKNLLVTQDMSDAVQVYLDFVNEVISEEKEAVFGFEQSFDLGWLHKGIFGTVDCWVYLPGSKILYVIDYKHGVGTAVDPEWNSQTMVYALGAVFELWASQLETSAPGFVGTKKVVSPQELVREVVSVIVQPRFFNAEEEGAVKTWHCSLGQLVFWGQYVLAPGAVRAEKGEGGLASGEHCKFCPAIGVCPAQIEKAMVAAKTDFNGPLFPSPEDLSPEELSKIAEFAELFGSWMDGIKAFIKSRMETGLKVPGWKLVAAKATRSWTDELLVVRRLEAALGAGAAYNKKLRSVKQAEDALKAAKLSPETILRDCWAKFSKGLSLVRESDRRKEVASAFETEFSENINLLE